MPLNVNNNKLSQVVRLNYFGVLDINDSQNLLNVSEQITTFYHSNLMSTSFIDACIQVFHSSLPVYKY